jgi:hypothetical protein
VIETTFQFGKVSKLLLHASYLDLRGARMTLLLRSSLSNMLPKLGISSTKGGYQ